MNRKRSVVKQMYRWSLVTAAALLMAVVCLGQAAPEKKSYTFHGKVEVVNESDNSLQVNNEKIEGWMVAMSMVYSVDDPAIIKKLKVGDQIVATVYDGDYSILHKVQVVQKPTDASKSKK
jgi:Cu/Ag efflux protein CusF